MSYLVKNECSKFVSIYGVFEAMGHTHLQNFQHTGKISGLLTMGTENSATPNGINSFSGYMKTKSSSGVATTAPRVWSDAIGF